MKSALAFLASFALTLAAVHAQDAEAASPLKPTSLLQTIQGGGVMMIPLGILSIITVTLIIIFFFSLRRGTIVSGRYMQTADALIRKRDFLGLLAVSNRHNDAIARIMQRTMDFMTRNPRATLAEAREIAQSEGSRQAAAINQQIAWLADIGTIAPMLGLLGTVMGIVQSFGVIAMDSAGSRPTMLAHGVGEALIATATGLLVGIPAMAAYAFFRAKASARISDLETASAHLFANLSASFSEDKFR